MSSRTIILMTTIFLGSSPLAAMGDHDYGPANGGDSCELLIEEIRDELYHWIKQGSGRFLEMPEGVSLEQYERAMVSALEPGATRVSCTTEPIRVRGYPKTCRNFFDDAGNAVVQCNKSRFEESKVISRYGLIHHEYSGIAKLEMDTKLGSTYSISKQIKRFVSADRRGRIGLQGPDVVLAEIGISDAGISQVIADQSFEDLREILQSLDKAAGSVLTTEETDDGIIYLTLRSKSDDSIRAVIRFEEDEGYHRGLIKVTFMPGSVINGDEQPVEEAKALCSLDMNFCPTLNVLLETNSRSRRSLILELFASSRTAPADHGYGVRLDFRDTIKGPMWSVHVWSDREDTGEDILFAAAGSQLHQQSQLRR